MKPKQHSLLYRKCGARPPKNSEFQTPAQLSVVVPIYNEEASLPGLLPGLIVYCRERNWQVILVNDGSTDATPQILRAFAYTPGVRVLNHKVNCGYGSALKTGIRQVITPYLATIDGDGQHNIMDIDRVFSFALEKDADLVIGARLKPRNSISYRLIGKWVIRKFAQLLMPIPVSDLNSGFKLYRTDLVQKYIGLCPSSMAFSDIITLIFINQHHLVLEYPITVKQRSGGKSTISAYTALETVIEIINIAMMFNPLKIFLPLSIFCILFGFLWGGRILLLGRGVSVGSLLAVVVGLWFFTIGLIAAQISAFRIALLEGDRER